MRGWIELCSDVNWIDYHGMWAKKARDGSWYVLRWTNLVDAGGDEFADCPFECDVKRIDLADTPPDAIASALRSCGYRLTPEGVCSDSGDLIEPQYQDRAILEMCIGYGLGAPMHTETGAKHPLRIRAAARRVAEELMRDADKRDALLARPVNAIGSTAAEYGRGDIDSALNRGAGSTDPAMIIMRKMHGK